MCAAGLRAAVSKVGSWKRPSRRLPRWPCSYAIAVLLRYLALPIRRTELQFDLIQNLHHAHPPLAGNLGWMVYGSNSQLSFAGRVNRPVVLDDGSVTVKLAAEFLELAPMRARTATTMSAYSCIRNC